MGERARREIVERARERTNARVFSSRRSRRVSRTTRDAVVVRRRRIHSSSIQRIRFDSIAMMTSSTRFRAMMVAVFACALALVASPLGADAAHSNVVTRVPDSTYATPGYEGPSTTDQGRCAYPQTSTNYFEHMGPNYCRSSTGPDRNSSGARCDLQGRDVCEQFTGIPRVDPRNNKEYVGQMEFTDDYISSIIGHALPGIIIAGLLLVSMILVLIFYVLSSVCKCCGLCR